MKSSATLERLSSGRVQKMELRRNIGDDGAIDGVHVWLVGHARPFRLLKNHSMFDEFYSTLITSLTAGLTVTFGHETDIISYMSVNY